MTAGMAPIDGGLDQSLESSLDGKIRSQCNSGLRQRKTKGQRTGTGIERDCKLISGEHLSELDQA